ncbi:phenylacetate-CoA oxygenase subunit PaaC [Ginsengibacter hankyongi]|uniref:Phenylacetate-CoA oxygenase subunit PaaC n=1 Tax=Ginsengibacter hankyongi TaxID=2607284 RepID=A0A5J5ING2_9BACT|nr:1,2-phenylacetyl-CoA epoxidase subunit PaaC [Ginsengibacter hankyongi]KAA9042078.1 phenylacetate-CoA oxygenase subunit PaaC [Ginsengibacter hankyongi]
MENNLFNYTLHLADNSLTMGHRLSEWTGHGPMLEQDIAISNIALDLIGQSRNFYQYAAALKDDSVTEDLLAYLRDAREFKNLLITEIPNGDWAKTIMKLFLFSTYQFCFYQKLIDSSDKQLAAIAEKSLKEVTYHVRWSSEWVIRLGDGTEESNKRIKLAMEEVWPFTGEMFQPAEYESLLINNRISVDVSEIKNDWMGRVKSVLEEATLSYPEDKNTWMQTGGKNGIHTEHLGYLLAEMQFLQRAYPGCEW